MLTQERVIESQVIEDDRGLLLVAIPPFISQFWVEGLGTKSSCESTFTDSWSAMKPDSSEMLFIGEFHVIPCNLLNVGVVGDEDLRVYSGEVSSFCSLKISFPVLLIISLKRLSTKFPWTIKTRLSLRDVVVDPIVP